MLVFFFPVCNGGGTYVWMGFVEQTWQGKRTQCIRYYIILIIKLFAGSDNEFRISILQILMNFVITYSEWLFWQKQHQQTNKARFYCLLKRIAKQNWSDLINTLNIHILIFTKQFQIGNNNSFLFVFRYKSSYKDWRKVLKTGTLLFIGLPIWWFDRKISFGILLSKIADKIMMTKKTR